jgi:nicotinate-nucleotide adenylyltransferase
MVAGWLRWVDRADEVWFVPVHRHAFDKALAPWDVRVAMCHALATQLGPWARVEPIEADLPGVSYTVRTLDALASRHPGVELRLVVGADVLGQVHQWRDWDTIAARYHPILVGRAGYVEVPDAPVFPDISSTEIRRRVAAGERWDHLVPAGVARLVPEAGYAPAGVGPG